MKDMCIWPAEATKFLFDCDNDGGGYGSVGDNQHEPSSFWATGITQLKPTN